MHVAAQNLGFFTLAGGVFIEGRSDVGERKRDNRKVTGVVEGGC